MVLVATVLSGLACGWTVARTAPSPAPGPSLAMTGLAGMVAYMILGALALLGGAGLAALMPLDPVGFLRLVAPLLPLGLLAGLLAAMLESRRRLRPRRADPFRPLAQRGP